MSVVGTKKVKAPKLDLVVPPPLWAQVMDFQASGQFNAVSCVSAKQCTAVGMYGPNLSVGPGSDEPAYDAENKGVWVWDTAIQATGNGVFASVSCTQASDCTAVGGDSSGAIYATESRGAWGPIGEVPIVGGSNNNQFTGVSCTDNLNCTAVGWVAPGNDNTAPIYATESNGVWSPAIALTLPQGVIATFSGVACSAPSECVAVGQEEPGTPALSYRFMPPKWERLDHWSRDRYVGFKRRGNFK